MRIKYFKITNFAGIHYGIANNVFELKDIPNGIIMLSGENGSGKSTVLHSLHIFSDDKSFLIKNDDGSFEPASKEIIIEHNGFEYSITHQYNNKGSKKSFISKNGEELNAAGNQATFEDVVLKEFGMEDSPVANSVIGVSSNSFIELTSAQRKANLASLLPNIEMYESAHKSANDQLNGTKKQFQMMANLIASNGSIPELQDKLKDIESKEQPVNDEIKKIEESNILLGQQEAVINSKISDLSNKNNELLTQAAQENEKYLYAQRTIEKFQNININESVEVLNSKSDVLQNQINNMTIEMHKKEVQIKQMNNEWSNYQQDVINKQNIENNKLSLQNKIKSTQEELDMIDQEIAKINNIERKSYFTEDVKDLLLFVGKNIKQELDEIDNASYISINGMSNLEIYNDYQNNIQKVALYESKEKEVGYLNNIINLFSNISNATSNVDSSIQMTDGCNPSKCAKQYSTLLSDYKTKYDANTKFLEDNREKYEAYKAMSTIRDRYKGSYAQRYELADKLNIDKSEFEVLNLKHILNKLRDFNNEINSYFQAISKIDEKNSSRKQILNNLTYLKETLANTKDIEVREIDFNKEDIISLQEEIKEMKDQINKKHNELDKLKSDINNALEYMKLDKMVSFVQEYTKRQDEISNINNNINIEKANLKNILDQIVANKDIIRHRMDILNSFKIEKEDISKKIAIIESNIQEKEKLDQEINDRSLIVSALHPTKGIPSLLVGTYLNKIENICNDILDRAFQGNYKVSLENLDKDFFISVYEKSTDRYLPDINLVGSSGQKAIIKLVIGIALMKLGISGSDEIYLRLDEIDSTLSKNNVLMIETFLNSLLSQFEISQVFIVTHQSAVSIADMNIVFDRDDSKYTVTTL